MTLKVEKCTPQDVNDVAKMEQAYIECYWSKQNILDALSSDGYTFYKAMDGDKFVGYGGVQWCPPEGNICNVAVDENARRLGVGSAILNAIKNECKDRGVTQLFLEVNERNDGAIALYQARGFEVIGKRPRYYGNDSAILMKSEIE